MQETTRELTQFLTDSPTAFHAVEEISKQLDSAGFEKLGEQEEWRLAPGGRYYTARNGSSIIAFALPKVLMPEDVSFLITASHTDSPTFKLKAEAESEAAGKYIKLNIEAYGGVIYSSWLDRPLSVAGRAIVKEDGKLKTRLIKIDRDLVVIPNVAIHQNRAINGEFSYNPAVDLMPLFAEKESACTLAELVAAEAGVTAENLAASDLYLYNRTPAAIWGAKNEFFSAPRIDNLQCAYATLKGFLQAVLEQPLRAIAVYSSFDNEETGSATKQGAGSQMLFDTLSRIAETLQFDLRRALATSFMVSADNAHARHPNHPELSDERNAPALNEGIVIKSNAAQKYTTDALSAAIFGEICKTASVPTQRFANRSDMPGGSTLGSISNTNVALATVDVGLPQLAMHSCYETAGTKDTDFMIRAIAAFYRSRIKLGPDGSCEIS